MTNIDYIEQSIDIFEDSLKAGGSRPYSSVKALSEKIGYSSHYLSRLFQSLCGQPMGQYMLKRRLSEAYLRIRDTDEVIRNIAAELGWEDYSSFSRAFKKEFAVSAGKARTTVQPGLDNKLTVRTRPANPAFEGFSKEPVLCRLPPLHVTGLVFFMDGSEKTFHKPWHVYAKNQHKIKGVLSPELTYQCSFWPEDEDPSHGMWILCAKETDPEVRQDVMFFSKRFSNISALSFTHTGPVESMHHTYAYIWGEYLPKSVFKPTGNFEFQRYVENTDAIEILLPVST